METNNTEKTVFTIPPLPKGKKQGGEKPKLRVAAYCRVSTDTEEQATSYEAQIAHYTAYIGNHPEWTLAGVFADADAPYGLNPNCP